MLTEESPVSRAGLDALALKPKEHDLSRAVDLPVDTVNIDYEGHAHFPSDAVLEALAADKRVFATTPVRADGFDPLGDDSHLPLLEGVGRVLVAGHGAYLTETEATKAIAPRLHAARETAPEAWVGTEGIERLALAAGGTQYELLSRGTERSVRALRAAGYEGRLAVYAPVVLAAEETDILDAVGGYAARRGPVVRALPEGASTDGTATGRAREVLSEAVRDYALVGDAATVREQTDTLREAGVDTVVGYPARGLDAFF
ncbi:DUF7388 family protein [Halorarius litoreus]|uniref:DUF7388 family protein n=1 Tax=Halorarius litoreus TaxID=2962676 RepID=UPI0020CD4C96|nr:luciferase [Halorarius litoreus]